MKDAPYTILGDPGAVSRVGRKDGTNVFEALSPVLENFFPPFLLTYCPWVSEDAYTGEKYAEGSLFDERQCFSL